ncbi:MAG: thioredoxin [bacterium]
MAKELTAKNFKKEVLESKLPVMVDFWASWCGPCKIMGPIVEELAEEMKDSIKIAKVNIEDEEALATEYGVMSIPTFLFFKNGKVIDQTSGAMLKDKLVKMLKKLIK